MDASWAAAGWAAVAGAAAGLSNQLFRFVHDAIASKRAASEQVRALEHQATLQAREQEHQRALQREEREHQAVLRREAAFFTARAELLPDAVAAYEWLDWELGEKFGLEYDYYRSHNQPPKFSGPAQVIAAFNRIAGEHPTRRVRLFARSLASDVDGTLNELTPQGSKSEIEEDDLQRWRRRSQALVEALHDPDFDPSAVDAAG